MPTSAAVLAQRRAALDLPATLPGAELDVPVTGEFCAWLEGLLDQTQATWTTFQSGGGLGSRTSTQLVLTVRGPGGHPVVTVEFDKRGRWLCARASTSGYWNRGRTAGENASAIDYYRAELRNGVFAALRTQPNPPDWVVSRMHREELSQRAQEEAEREQRTALARERQERLNQRAKEQAAEDLIAAHPEEFERLLEQRRVEVALTDLSDRDRLAFV